ncbi:MAG: gamma carbonic anhydrase family protein [Rickettsiales bacterium]
MLPYSGVAPSIAQGAYVAPNAYVIGDVTVGSGSGIWFGCTVRGDVAYVRIGENTNIQDGTVIHVTRGGHPTIIGNGVTVGHKALLHACRLEDACFIGMGAIVMDDAVVETGAMVAAGALVTPGKRVPTGEIWAGNPARFFRMLTSAETTHIAASRDNYVAHVREYLSA